MVSIDFLEFFYQQNNLLLKTKNCKTIHKLKIVFFLTSENNLIEWGITVGPCNNSC